jgi:hypothetical protein
MTFYVVLGDGCDKVPDGDDRKWDVNGSHQVGCLVVRVKVTLGRGGGRGRGKEVGK